MSSTDTSPDAANQSDPAARRRQVLTFLLRLLGTGIALYLVFLQINIELFGNYLKNMSLTWLLLAWLAFNVSQLLGAARFRYYVSNESVTLPWQQAIALHYQGLLLNIVLPGGISGDGYKAIVLRRRYDIAVKRLVQFTLSNRLNGLLWLVLLALALMPASSQIQALPSYSPLLLGSAACLALAGYAIIARFMLAEPVRLQIAASAYSLPLQIMMIITAACLYNGLHGDSILMLDYIVVFLISCVAATLPVSIGGIGVRELVLMQGSLLLNIDAQLGVALAITFFILYLLTSVLGIAFLTRVISTK